MVIFKCKMCGGTIEFNEGATVGVCDSCGTKQTLPRLDDDRRSNLYDRANHFRRNNDFDKAAAIYEQILNEDTTDAEAYWSLVLCQYGIEYVEDPATRKRVPTVNRAQFTSIFDDDNYKSAIQYADGYQRELYEKEAKAINDIQKGILAISQKEDPYDVFICYKETDASGRRTPDSVLANDLYHQLTQEGFKVFFARITLEDKLGTAYEPYIFAALNSAKVMVVLGTKPEHFNAVWVKNEWSRYLTLVKQSSGKKVLIPAYRDMDPYDLPEEFSHLQAQDMSKLGFMQDLIRGIKKIAKVDEPKATVKETVVVGTNNANVAPLLKRAFMFLEDGNWTEADSYCEKVLDQDPENAQAYLGKLMAELRVCKQEDLQNCKMPFNDNGNLKKAMRFADKDLILQLESYLSITSDRIAIDRKKLNDTVNGIVAAFKMHLSGSKPVSLKQQLDTANQELSKTEQIINIFDDTHEQIKSIDAIIKVLVEKERRLEEKKKSLGIFAGKEKKVIVSELLEVQKEIEKNKLSISNILHTLGDFNTKSEVSEKCLSLKNKILHLEEQIMNDDSEPIISFEQALDLVKHNKEVLEALIETHPEMIEELIKTAGLKKDKLYTMQSNNKTEYLAIDDLKIGSIYKGVITKLFSFGAIVELAPGKEGLIHISLIDDNKVERVEDCLNVGDEVIVKIKEIDQQGRINLSRKDAIIDAKCLSKKNTIFQLKDS